MVLFDPLELGVSWAMMWYEIEPPLLCTVLLLRTADWPGCGSDFLGS